MAGVRSAVHAEMGSLYWTAAAALEMLLLRLRIPGGQKRGHGTCVKESKLTTGRADQNTIEI